MAEAQIKTLRHRVALCSIRDVVVAGDTIELSKLPVAWVWSQIEPQSSLPSYMSRAGYAIFEVASAPTHRITIRYQVELDFTATSWIYEERRKSPPRWYKVLGFEEDEGRWLILICHLVEKSGLALPPRTNLSPQPNTVRL